MKKVQWQKDKAAILVTPSEAFARVVFTDLEAEELKPLFAILDAHKAVMVGDYRGCVEKFVADYGRQPDVGFYETAKSHFNSAAMLSIRVPRDRVDTLEADIKEHLVACGKIVELFVAKP